MEEGCRGGGEDDFGKTWLKEMLHTCMNSAVQHLMVEDVDQPHWRIDWALRELKNLPKTRRVGQDDEVHKELHVGEQLNTGALNQTRSTESTRKKTQS